MWRERRARNPSIDEATADHRKLLGLVFQFVAPTNIALGAAIAALGPGFVGGDPPVDTVICIGGGVLALGGLAMIWFARRRFGDGRAGGLRHGRADEALAAPLGAPSSRRRLDGGRAVLHLR